MTQLKNMGLLILLGCMSCYCYWHFIPSRSIVMHLEDRVLNQLPDQLASRLYIQRFNETGTLIYQLYAASAYHIPQDNQHYLTHPILDVSSNHQPDWHLSSTYAVSKRNGEEIQFNQKVHVHHEQWKQYPKGDFKTNRLVYFSKENKIDTDQPVLWTQEHHQLESKGLSVDLTHQTLKLHQNVKLHQDNFHLEASQAHTQTDSHAKLLMACAEGNSTQQAHFWIDKDPKYQEIHAYADKMMYDPQKKLIQFIGHAHLHQEQALFSAPNIVYDIEKKHMITTQALTKEQTTLSLPKQFLGKSLSYDHLVRQAP